MTLSSCENERGRIITRKLIANNTIIVLPVLNWLEVKYIIIVGGLSTPQTKGNTNLPKKVWKFLNLQSLLSFLKLILLVYAGVSYYELIVYHGAILREFKQPYSLRQSKLKVSIFQFFFVWADLVIRCWMQCFWASPHWVIIEAAKPSVPFGGWYRGQDASMWSFVWSTVQRWEVFFCHSVFHLWTAHNSNLFGLFLEHLSNIICCLFRDLS